MLAGLLALPLSAACGSELPPPDRKRAPIVRGRIDPAELFPEDLDLVVRFDLGRMRAELGPMADVVSARVEAEGKGDEALLSATLRRAKIVWIGLRLADLDAGDRVLVVEGDVEDVRPDERTFALLNPPLADGVMTFDRKGPLRRGETARIHAFGGRAIAFVTPVEVDSVDRVLLRGPDARRRDPSAEGLVSADLRVHGLPPSLERRYTKITSIVRGVEGARASAAMIAGESLRVELEIKALSGEAAKKVESLVRALREGGRGSRRYAVLFEDMRLELVERTLRVRWTFAAAALRAMLEGGTDDVEEPR